MVDSSVKLDSKTPGSWVHSSANDFCGGEISTLPNDKANPPNTNVPTLEIKELYGGEVTMISQILWQEGYTRPVSEDESSETGGLLQPGLRPIPIPIDEGYSYAETDSAGNVLIVDLENVVFEVDKDHNLLWKFMGMCEPSPVPIPMPPSLAPRDHEGSPCWNMPISPLAATKLTNGNVLISDATYIVELDVDDYDPTQPCNGFTDESVLRGCEIEGIKHMKELPNGNILLSSNTGNFVAEIDMDTCNEVWRYGNGNPGSGVNELNGPTAAYQTSDGNILIADRENCRVIKIRKSDYGHYSQQSILWSYGSGVCGSGINQLNKPSSVYELPTGNVLISDSGNNRVIEVKTSDYAPQLPNFGYTDRSIVWSYGSTSGAGPNQLSSPASAIRVADGRTLIADQRNRRVIFIGYLLQSEEESSFISSVVDGGASEVDKYFTKLSLNTEPLVDGQSFEILYSINGGDFLSLGTVEPENGTSASFDFPSGTIGKTVRYKVVFKTVLRDKAPVLNDVTIEYYFYNVEGHWLTSGQSGFSQGTINNLYLNTSGTLVLDGNWVELQSAPPSVYASGAESAEMVESNGSIYAFGGVNGGSVLNRSLKYDISTNSWTELSPSDARVESKVYEENGKFYMVGGKFLNSCGPTSPPPECERYPSEIKEYDPISNLWTNFADYTNPRGGAGITKLGSKVYISGGYSYDEIWMPGRRSFVYVDHDDIQEIDLSGAIPRVRTMNARLPTGRAEVKAFPFSNKIYLLGGSYRGGPRQGGGYLDELLEYDPVSDSIITKSRMDVARGKFTAQLVGEKIYVFGGEVEVWESGDGFWIGHIEKISSSRVYDIKTDTWSTIADMPFPITGGNSVVINNRYVFILGGTTSDETGGEVVVDTPIVYDTVSDSWTVLPPKRSPGETGYTILSNGGDVYEFGGVRDGEPLNSLYKISGRFSHGTYESQSVDAALPDKYKLLKSIGWVVENNGGSVELLYSLDGGEWISAGTSGIFTFPDGTKAKTIRYKTVFHGGEKPWESPVLSKVELKYLVYGAKGSVVSKLISPSKLGRWDKLRVDQVLGSGGMITFDILDKNSNAIPGFTGLVPASDIDISKLPVSYSSIKIRGNLSSSDSSNTPVLAFWSVFWRLPREGPPGKQPSLPLIEDQVSFESPVPPPPEPPIKRVGGELDAFLFLV